MHAPASNVPQEIAGFHGKWVGYWTSARASTLVVEQIEGRTTALIYSWGEAPGMENSEPGFRRIRGTFGDDSVLRAKLGPGPNAASIAYTLNSQGTLDARWERGERRESGVFKRVDK